MSESHLLRQASVRDVADVIPVQMRSDGPKIHILS